MAEIVNFVLHVFYHNKKKSKEKWYTYPHCIYLRWTITTSKKMKHLLKTSNVGFPGGAVVKNPPVSAGDSGSSPGPGRSHMPRNN